MSNLYERYAVLEAESKRLETEKEALRTEILEEMERQGKTKEETAVGSFTVSKLKSWTYPEYVTEINEQFKTAKIKAQQSGEATYEEKSSLRFTSITF